MKKLQTIQSLCLLIFGLFVITSCSSDEEEPAPAPTAPVMITSTIWDGPRTTFTKAVGSDPNSELNQDRITDNVWITRGTSGGEIYNARTEDNSLKGISPAGTRWARGTTSNLSALQFDSFRNAVGSPQNVVGVDLVLMLIEDDVLIDVNFSSWSSGRNDGGGFAYTRSTAP